MSPATVGAHRAGREIPKSRANQNERFAFESRRLSREDLLIGCQERDDHTAIGRKGCDDSDPDSAK
jgi:hypothetical protein